MTAPASPVQVATALRWSVARGVLLDPFAWVGGVLLALVLARSGEWLEPRFGALSVTAAASFLTLAVGTGFADSLLFRNPENDLLRIQPLGPRGLAEVRHTELGWWLQVPALLGAAVALGAGGAMDGLAAYIAGRCGVGAATSCAVIARAAVGRAGAALGGAAVVLLAGAALVACEGLALPPWSGAALAAGVGLALGQLRFRLWDARYEGLASEALSAPSSPHAPGWALLSRLLPLPSVLKARVLRDGALLVRGADGRGALLLMLSPLAVLGLQFDPTPTSGQLLWQALTAAALGSGAIAYAVGPGVHRLRVQVLPWERTAPAPGRRALLAGLAWGGLWACLHAGWILAVIATARNGWFAGEVGSLALPVFALELAAVHFSVVFTLSRALGQTVNGEGMLAIALPMVAVGVALAAVLFPAAILLYPLATVGMTAQAAGRLDQLEVTW